MGINISIKNVPKNEVERLRARAKRNHRSLQGELRIIIAEAAGMRSPSMSFDELLAQGRAIGLTTPDEATQWIRELRDSR